MNPTLLSSSEDDYLIHTDCYDATTLITNGTATEPKEFPHMVTIWIIRY